MPKFDLVRYSRLRKSMNFDDKSVPSKLTSPLKNHPNLRLLRSASPLLPPLLLLLGLMNGCGGPSGPGKTGIYLDDAYIKTAVPGRTMTAAYATIINHEPERLCLTHFAAPFAGEIELHATEPVGEPNSGRVRMRQLAQLCLDPGERAELKPGGMHLMVMGLRGLDSTTPSVPIVIGTTTGRAFEGDFRIQSFSE